MKGKIYFPILFKLVILTTILLAAVTLIVSFKSSSLFESMSTDREESINMENADSVSFEVDNLIQSYIDKINFYSVDLLKDGVDNESSNDFSLKNDPEFYALYIKRIDTNKEIKVINSKNPSKNIDQNSIINQSFLNLTKKESLVISGKIVIQNLSSINGIAAYALGIPLLKNEFGEITSIAWGIIKVDRLQKIFTNKRGRNVFLVDSEGRVLAHQKENYILNQKDMSFHPIVREGLSSQLRTKQKYFEAKLTNDKMLGAFAKTSTDLLIISEIPMSVVFAPSNLVRNNTYFILGIALSISFFFIFLFSLTLTTPIEKLLGLTKEIAQGNFDVVARNEIQSKDEVGLLAVAFDEMTIGLKERDKMKNLFTKFHGTAVTEELLQNEISLGGKRKEVTVFFSDIRGFTDFSEGHTPEEVVSMLNEYFEVMVRIINDNGGVVDKFIGDAIMAVWGVPNTSKEDTENAIRACLEMRMALNTLNENRLSRQLTPIKIGMGLHAGEAISGQIGSSERMEFTVIGDAVNTASRIEGSTKSFGTDLLISKECIEKIDYSDFILEKAGEAKVQGKSENLVLYKVNGIVLNGEQKILETPYSAFEAVEDKKSKKAS